MRKWYTMKAEQTAAEIVIYDEIGKSWWNEDAIGAKQFLDDLNALGDVDSITLRINSPGGDVFDGVAIHNSLKNHKAKVTAQIDGIAASAASFIAMAADKIVMPSNSFLLIHGASGLALGGADVMRATADDLDRIDNSLTATYVARAKSTTEPSSGASQMRSRPRKRWLQNSHCACCRRRRPIASAQKQGPRRATRLKLHRPLGARRGSPPFLRPRPRVIRSIRTRRPPSSRRSPGRRQRSRPRPQARPGARRWSI